VVFSSKLKTQIPSLEAFIIIMDDISLKYIVLGTKAQLNVTCV